MNLRTALELGRVSNLPTTWSNVLSGLSLAGASRADFSLAPWLMLAVSLHYVGGMYLNDAFDRELDAAERPTRPIPSGRVQARTVFALGYGMLGLGLWVLAALALLAPEAGAGPLVGGVLLCGCIVLYDARHKANPLAPVVMGACRVLVYAVAALAVSSALPAPLLVGMAALWSYLIGLTYAARQENLNRLGSMWPLGCLAVPFGLLLLLPVADSGVVGLGILTLFVASTAHGAWLLASPAARDVPRAVGQLIAGISLLDGVLVAAQGHPQLAAGCVAAWGLTRLFQRTVPGT